jgi:hypothetical protein
MGTITVGAWSGSVVAGAYGTGVNNGSFTATLGASLTSTMGQLRRPRYQRFRKPSKGRGHDDRVPKRCVGRRQ